MSAKNKKRTKAKSAPRKSKKRKPSKKNGRKAGRQPIALGQETVKHTLRLPANESKEMKDRADAIAGKVCKRNVSGYLRELVRRDLASQQAS